MQELALSCSVPLCGVVGCLTIADCNRGYNRLKSPVNQPNQPMNTKGKPMNEWFWYAIGAAILYGMHQVFTRMASDRIGDGLGGFVVEGTAALTILLYLLSLYVSGQLESIVQHARECSIPYSPEFALASARCFSFCCFKRAGRCRQCR